MATDKRARKKGRQGAASFMGIPHHILESCAYASLDGWAVRLLVDIAAQYKGYNNGDLTAAWTIMKPKGWRSKGTLNKALIKLKGCGLIEITRQGGRHKPSLYAITWQSIDECKGKLEVKPTTKPSNLWRDCKLSSN
ncbi:MAG: hypothetical protein P1U67_11645 [Alcanivoracaceae bacterium]|nr:hypothetical protein [Alcanivoracaceae bacterium]